MHPVCVINRLETAKQSLAKIKTLQRWDWPESAKAGWRWHRNKICELAFISCVCLIWSNGQIKSGFEGWQCNVTVPKTKSTFLQKCGEVITIFLQFFSSVFIYVNIFIVDFFIVKIKYDNFWNYTEVLVFWFFLQSAFCDIVIETGLTSPCKISKVYSSGLLVGHKWVVLNL